jgi:predicted secreted hydrolase
LTPFQRAALAALMSMLILGSTLSAANTSAATPQAGSASPLVHFPADQAAHSHVQNEWWYVVGHLHSGNRTFGYEMTIFKFDHVRPPGLTTPLSLYRTDVAITDEGSKRFHQQVTYYFPQSASVSYTSLAVRVGSTSLKGASGNMRLAASFSGGSLSLNLSSRRAPMYVGGRGYIPFGNGFTYYYSLTDLATSGSITVAGERYSIQGLSWLDHQWGNWSWTTIRGWIWMALQLDNGVQMSVFDLRGTRTRVKAASVLLTNGSLRTLYDAQVTSTGQWRSPHTGGRYPSGWIVRIPSLRAVFTVKPTVSDQEVVVPLQASTSYWEGSGRLTGTLGGKRVSGLSYTELTGYASSASR